MLSMIVNLSSIIYPWVNTADMCVNVMKLEKRTSLLFCGVNVVL